MDEHRLLDGEWSGPIRTTRELDLLWTDATQPLRNCLSHRFDIRFFLPSGEGLQCDADVGVAGAEDALVVGDEVGQGGGGRLGLAGFAVLAGEEVSGA